MYVAATLVDDVSSGAVRSMSEHPGMSVHMSMNYFSPTPGGQDCEVDSRVTKVGRTLAFAEVHPSPYAACTVSQQILLHIERARDCWPGEGGQWGGGCGDRGGRAMPGYGKLKHIGPTSAAQQGLPHPFHSVSRVKLMASLYSCIPCCSMQAAYQPTLDPKDSFPEKPCCQPASLASSDLHLLHPFLLSSAVPAWLLCQVDIRNKHTGKVTAKGTHIKFIPKLPGQASNPSAAATPEAANSFLSDMISDAQEGFQPEATTNFETTALHGLKDITASSGRVVCILPVLPRVQNRYNTLHGGCSGGAICQDMPSRC